MLDNNNSDLLIKRIKSKRQELADYLKRQEPKNKRLINYSIICGAVAAALTAGPGVGGESLVDSVKDTLSFGIPLWQVLCLMATVLSVAGVIINSIMKSQDLTSKLASVRSCDAKLEGLETMLELAQIKVEEATPLYTQYLTEIPHI